jgi:uncharacterized coiled-coil DUF342 family protein
MPKELTKKAGISAAEGVLRSLMPELLGQMDAIRQDIRAMRMEMQEEFRDVDRRVEQLKTEMYDKFEQSRDVINEVGQRIARLEGRIQGYFETARNQNNKIDGWIERIVKVETLQSSRRRKAS